MATVLTILPEGFEELEAIAPIDLWRRAGMHVTVAALASKREVMGRNKIMVVADKILGSVGPDAVFDVLFLPGGPGVSHLRESPEIREILGRQFAADKWITAICAAPLALKDAGLLAGRKYTAHPSTATELPEANPAEKVVVDGKIVTSRGAGTSVEFGLKVIELLEGVEKADEIALSICAKSPS